jgi:hypothetical protein
MGLKDVRPGQKVKDSGIYESNRSKDRATMVHGEKAPPTRQPGEYWRQVYNTNPDRKR